MSNMNNTTNLLNEQNKSLKDNIDLRKDFAPNYLCTRNGKDGSLLASDCPCGQKTAQNKKDTHCQVFAKNILCYACSDGKGDKGRYFDVFELIMEKEKCSFVDAKEIVAKHLNIEIEKPKKLFTDNKQLFLNEYFHDTCINNQNNNFSKFCTDKLGITTRHLRAWVVGTFGNGLTIFLQKDLQGRVWNYQAIDYKENGKKAGTVFSAKQPDANTQTYYQSLIYGFHLLREEKSIPIIVVESPKTAVVASFFYPEYDFVACMSANGLTEYFCELLMKTQKNIFWLCDSDGNEYNEKNILQYGGRLNSSITNLAKICTAKSYVIDLFPNYKLANDRIESKYHYDLADFIIENIENIKSNTIKLPELMETTKIFSAIYWSENIFVNANKHDVVFWEIKHKGKESYIQINNVKYRDFLISKGFCYIELDNKDKRVKGFIHIKNNIAEYTNEKCVNDFVLEYINNVLPEIIWKSDIPEKQDKPITRDNLINELISKGSFYFGDKTLQMLPTIDIDFLKDTKNVAYKPYRNGVVKIEKDYEQISVIPYENLNGFIVWKYDIINRDFKQVKKEDIFNFSFYKFMELTQFSDIKDKQNSRVRNLIKTIGYLLHGYKHQSIAKFVYVTDESSDNKDKGGSGKSLVFHKALDAVSSVAYQAGKNWEFKKNTCFDFINYGQKIACINDLPENFVIDTIYNATTDAMTIRVLYSDTMKVSFEDSPKIVATGNFNLGGDKNADKRRCHTILFNNWFKDNNTNIEKHFGESFFQDWNKEQWNIFDNVMFYCLQIWLNEFTLEDIGEDYEIKRMNETLTSEEIASFDSFFKTKETESGWYDEYLIKKSEILDATYPENERGSRSKESIFKRLKMVLTIYFERYAKEVYLKTTSGKAPYYSDGSQDYIVIKIKKDKPTIK